MLTFVYVIFDFSRQYPEGPAAVNELGIAMSYEPRKWSEILHRRVRHQELDDEKNRDFQMLRSTIKYCWTAGPLSPATLYLMLDMDEDQHDFGYIQELMMQLFLGCTSISVANEAIIEDHPIYARILPFRIAA